MSAEREPIRSYQRIFRPERRIYQVEGHVLPVPGGVPLRWLAYTAAALLAILLLGSRSLAIVALVGLAAAATGGHLGGRGAALTAGAAAAAGAWVLGQALGLIDWPLRLVVLPAGIGSLATQATPDGRRADRFATSWLALRLAPRRRSLGRAVPAPGVGHSFGSEVWVAPDERSPVLRRARLRGPGSVAFSTSIGLRRARLGRGLVARRGRGAPAAARLALGADERLEVRP